MFEIPGELARTFCLSGLLLWIGLSLAIDPARFIKFSEAVAGALRTFGEGRPLYSQDTAQDSPRVRRGVRLAGFCIIVCAVLALVAP